MKKRIFSILLAIMLMLAAMPCNFAYAATVSASIIAVEDAFTEESDPDSPQGALNAATIITSYDAGAKPAATKRNVYLKYDLRSYDLSSLTSAKIRLFINSVANKADRTLTVYAMTNDWSEKTVTWNNAPTPDGAAITTYLQKYDKNNHADIWITIDVTSYVRAHFGEGIISFMISSDTGATKMDSKETVNPPSLEVSFASSAETGNVTVKYVDEDDRPIARAVTLSAIAAGRYAYPHDIPQTIDYQGTNYQFTPEKSVTEIEVSKSGANEIVLSYTDPMKTPDGVIKEVVTVCDDTFAKQTSVSEIFNSTDPKNIQVTMNLGSSGAAARRDGFIKFDLSDIPYTFITSAQLVGYVTSATNPGTRYISVYPTESTAWSETTLNWNNAPIANENPIAGFTVESGTTGAWVSADITDYCRSAGKALGFRMIADTAATTFMSKEGDSLNAMALVLRYTDRADYELSSVTVRTVDTNGEEISPSVTLDNCLVGDYYYTKTPDAIIENEKGVYSYSSALSTLHITIESGGKNEISLVYRKEGENMGTSVLAEAGGWNWCLDPRAVRNVDEERSSDKTYVAYIDSSGNIKATQYDNIENTYKQVYVRRGFTADDHSNPAVFVLPDHRVMFIYSKHTEESCFYYRISLQPNDISSLGEEKTVSTEGFGTVTYPTPFYMSATPESFYLFWRGVNWQPTVARLSLPDGSDEVYFEIEPTVFIDARTSESETNKRPYAKYASNGVDRIYVSYTYAHPDNVAVNTLYCSYLDVNEWALYDAAGSLLANIGEAPFKVTNDEDASVPHIVDRTGNVRNWNWETELDGSGNPVVLYVGISADSKTHLYYHSRWTGETWQTTYIDNGGKWFHDNTKGAEKCYSGGLCLDHDDTDIVFASIPVEGIYGTYYEIYKYVIENGEVVSKTAVTENSSSNNFRPYVVMNAKDTDAVYLVWLSGEYYYWSNKKDFLPSNGNVKFGFTNKVNTASVLTGYDATADFESIDLKNTDRVVTDLAFVDTTANGASVTWQTSRPDVIKENGALIRPDEITSVTVTATIAFSNQTFTKDYELTVFPKGNIADNLVFKYDFADDDVYDDNGQTMIADKSGNRNDARMMGSAGKINGGVLDLTANGRDSSNGNRAKSTNSYLIAPDYITNTLRSYTFIGRVKLIDTSLDYRLYDFGSGGTNSVFGRLSKSFQAGIKINDGTTQYVSADSAIASQKWVDVAYTYDAATRVTSLYLDGELAASGKTVETEAIELLGENTRNYIGRSQWWDTYYDYTARDNPDFNGYIDSFALYNTALTQEEIASLCGGRAELVKVFRVGKTLSVSVANNTQISGDYMLYARADGEYEVKSRAVTVDSGKNSSLVLDFDSEPDGVKVFLWSRTDPLIPMCSPVEK